MRIINIWLSLCMTQIYGVATNSMSQIEEQYSYITTSPNTKTNIYSYVNQTRKKEYIKNFSTLNTNSSTINVDKISLTEISDNTLNTQQKSPSFKESIISNVNQVLSSVEISNPNLEGEPKKSFFEISDNSLGLYLGYIGIIKNTLNVGLTNGSASIAYGPGLVVGFSFLQLNLAEATVKLNFEYVNIITSTNMTGRSIWMCYMEVPGRVKPKERDQTLDPPGTTRLVINIPWPSQICFMFGIGRQDLDVPDKIKNAIFGAGLELKFHRHVSIGGKILATLPSGALEFLTGKTKYVEQAFSEGKIEQSGGVVLFVFSLKMHIL